jgi:hypothetical protein
LNPPSTISRRKIKIIALKKFLFNFFIQQRKHAMPKNKIPLPLLLFVVIPFSSLADPKWSRIDGETLFYDKKSIIKQGEITSVTVRDHELSKNIFELQFDCKRKSLISQSGEVRPDNKSDIGKKLNKLMDAVCKPAWVLWR